ncbi:TetR/AcrR family transcriptional regulator [Corticibacter populi]|uniref:TetR/AcrR family transcriptional regulator n=1 Tax=Corticibacter populi TaxID=1550736 RepID=A0A3M6QP46_9BURK|nr:TetR/AcrR family transcriptional regulator [Corticibacter populi]RMX04834.1 TetR/AcrR family transcriptional regulator [Corticibacter populi]RZS33747.1 TetR family transcriptional regulator [Corticibacter populi]
MPSKSIASAAEKTALFNKGQQTRHAILDAAMRLVAQVGLEGLSIGALAELAGMSKSGVFAHFGSREELQIAVVEHYHHSFEQAVFLPALALPRGLPRLEGMVGRWMQRVLSDVDSGIFISGAVDFDDRPGPVREALNQSVRTWMAALLRAAEQCRELGQLRDDADARQLVFEIHGLVLALHYDARFLGNGDSLQRAQNGFARLIRASRPVHSGQH